MGGISDCGEAAKWSHGIMNGIDEGIMKYHDISLAAFLPEAHLLGAMTERSQASLIQIGCQSVHCSDVGQNGNFGAFTTGRTARSMKALGCTWTMVGHSEERRDLLHIIGYGTSVRYEAVSEILNERVKSADAAGLRILYCVGETAQEKSRKYEVIRQQIRDGLAGIDLKQVVVAYEPVWAIGPGMKVPDSDYIRDIATFIKSEVDVPVVYGGGLKEENAGILAGIAEVDGGLIGLTRFSGDIGFYPDECLRIIDAYLLP